MEIAFRHYVTVFRKLIIDGFQIFKRGNSSLYGWVYPKTSLPHKFRMSEAYDIYKIAHSFDTACGRTTFIPIRYNLFYTAETLWQKDKDGKQKGRV